MMQHPAGRTRGADWDRPIAHSGYPGRVSLGVLNGRKIHPDDHSIAFSILHLKIFQGIMGGVTRQKAKMKHIRNLWNDDNGQDLIEYTLLMSFVALAAAALFLGAGGNVKGVWATTNNQLAQANAKAS
jgi:Flp pilus assembly pilin Flp